jgi:hypothetical protein
MVFPERVVCEFCRVLDLPNGRQMATAAGGADSIIGFPFTDSPFGFAFFGASRLRQPVPPARFALDGETAQIASALRFSHPRQLFFKILSDATSDSDI